MSKEVIPFYILAVYKSSTYSTSSPIVGIFISFKFYFSHCSGCVVVFTCNSLMANDVEFFSVMFLLAIHMSSFVMYPFKYFVQF